MTITNLPSYPQQYISTQYHHHLSAAPASQHGHSVHQSHPHPHHQPQHAAYPHHAHPHHTPTHVLSGPIRTEPLTRKRPKYTRSKTGCLTCRVKKIKCDETKPTCTRCAHGQRECTWPENVPARKKTVPKKQAEGDDKSPALSPESASPASSSATPTAREASPARKSPLGSLSASEDAVSSRRPHSEPTTAAGSPMVSPVEPSSAVSRRPSLPQSVHSSSSVPYASSSQQLRPQQAYHSMTPPTVSTASYHHSPTSPHEYSPYNGSPVNGHSHAQIHRHDLPRQSRLADLSVETTPSNIGNWHSNSMMHSSVDPNEPFVSVSNGSREKFGGTLFGFVRFLVDIIKTVAARLDI
ncbi:hypothetical protein BU17DRAFT_89054 [Hysterangium stoloniferum]|nr:hypothetical protein BU17DRAFT_89054 [Hysterangium stoloniferum]